jgi:hypothetical protein
MSYKLHALAALPPGTEPPAPIQQETGWAPEPVWTWRKFLPLLGLQLRPLGRPPRHGVDGLIVRRVPNREIGRRNDIRSLFIQLWSI